MSEALDHRAVRFALQAYVLREPAVEQLLLLVRGEISLLRHLGGHAATADELERTLDAVRETAVMTW